ncbi:unnamed protein product [Protopolystoma xenopodis]|uniref:Uncharacterized protein n=1 Tax=Protopolystoma xenopodis TaxID=117903 RepID=A0A448XID4_9PLAT|nr:unnamed protein product [Protopolystoma xenopodis]
MIRCRDEFCKESIPRLDQRLLEKQLHNFSSEERIDAKTELNVALNHLSYAMFMLHCHVLGPFCVLVSFAEAQELYVEECNCEI